MPSAACTSTAGAGMMTASSEARDGLMATAAMASAPMAAAHSDRRLKWRGDMVSSFGNGWGQSRAGSAFRNRLNSFRCTRYGVGGGLLRRAPHEFVNKLRPRKALGRGDRSRLTGAGLSFHNEPP